MGPSFRSIPLALALVVALLSTIAVAVSPVAADERSDEAEFYALINELRVNVGVEPLVVHPELVTESRTWTDELVRAGSLRHANDLSIGVTETWALLGENVGYTDQTIQVLFNAFVASPSHYENLVEPTFDHVGVAVVHSPDGRIFTVHRFMDIVDESFESSPFAEMQAELDRAGI